MQGAKAHLLAPWPPLDFMVEPISINYIVIAFVDVASNLIRREMQKRRNQV